MAADSVSFDPVVHVDQWDAATIEKLKKKYKLDREPDGAMLHKLRNEHGENPDRTSHPTPRRTQT